MNFKKDDRVEAIVDISAVRAGYRGTVLYVNSDYIGVVKKRSSDGWEMITAIHIPGYFLFRIYWKKPLE